METDVKRIMGLISDMEGTLKSVYQNMDEIQDEEKETNVEDVFFVESQVQEIVQMANRAIELLSNLPDKMEVG